jgi:cell volume regulation protein A
MEMALVIILVGLIIFLAHLFAVLFQKTRLPDVLVLVVIGIVLGPLTGIIPLQAFGKIGNVFTNIALVIILFESGLGLSFSTLRESLIEAIWLTLISFLGAVIVVTLVSILMFKMSVLESLMLGSMLAATAPTVVIPLVNKLPLQQKSRTVLILESTFGEALCILLTLGFLQAIKLGQVKPTLLLGAINASFLLAAAIGAVAAFFWSTLLHRIRQLENSIFTTIAFVFIIFGITELLGYSGAISAFAFGIVLGNIQSLRHPIFRKLTLPQMISLNQVEKALFAEAVFLLKTFFFVYIGLSAHLTDSTLILTGLGLTLVLFLIRIPVVRLGMDKTMNRFDASIAAIMVPKGLAAAVLGSLILQAELEKGMLIQEVTYAVIVFSILITTALTFFIERSKLGHLYAFLFSKYATDIDIEQRSE